MSPILFVTLCEKKKRRGILDLKIEIIAGRKLMTFYLFAWGDGRLWVNCRPSLRARAGQSRESVGHYKGAAIGPLLNLCQLNHASAIGPFV